MKGIRLRILAVTPQIPLIILILPSRCVNGLIAQQNTLGILICGTGIGMSLAANRNCEIRAALCHDEYSARMSREHNNANILCLGARVIGSGLAETIVETWLNSSFLGGTTPESNRKI